MNIHYIRRLIVDCEECPLALRCCCFNDALDGCCCQFEPVDLPLSELLLLYLGAVVGVASYWMSRSVWLVGRNQQESWGITFCGVPPPSDHTAMGSKYRNIRQRQRVANFPNAFQMSTSEDQLLLSTVNNNWLRHKGHLLARPVLWQLLWQPLQDSTVGSLAFDCKGKTSDVLLLKI